MELSAEDSLRLNVLLANAEAVRIDEQNMVVYGLAGTAEAKVPLNPNCRPEEYLRRVREALSTAALGSPRGYPVFLQRWVRMGQIQNSPLEKLLMLGEPEAVVAVACAPGLTDELARRAWWAAPTPEVARFMLIREDVVRGAMGPVLANYLIEYLPFETEPVDMLNTVRLVLQPGLTDAATRRRIWESGRHRHVYRVAFLEMLPDDLPEGQPPRSDLERYRDVLETLSAAGNPIASVLARTLDGRGQAFLWTGAEALQKPANQDVCSALLNAIGRYFGAARCFEGEAADIGELTGRVDALCEQRRSEDVAQVLAACPQLAPDVRAVLVLAHVSEALATHVFARTDAVGTLLRRKLEPVIGPLLQQFTVLRSARTP